MYNNNPLLIPKVLGFGGPTDCDSIYVHMLWHGFRKVVIQTRWHTGSIHAHIILAVRISSPKTSILPQTSSRQLFIAINRTPIAAGGESHTVVPHYNSFCRLYVLQLWSFWVGDLSRLRCAFGDDGSIHKEEEDRIKESLSHKVYLNYKKGFILSLCRVAKKKTNNK